MRKNILGFIALITVLVFIPSCKDSSDEPEFPDKDKKSFAFFFFPFLNDGGVHFTSGFDDYDCVDPYIVKSDCFEIIDGKWYALEYNAYISGGTDVYLLVNGEKKSTILSNCSAVINSVAYQEDGRFKAYIFYYDANDNYHGIFYDNGEIKQIDGLTDFERILFLKVINNDVYIVWNFDVQDVYEVGNIVITKNGTPIEQNIKLPKNSYVKYFQDLCVEGSTIYTFFTLVLDGYQNQAYYAKNNKLVKMTGLHTVSYGQVVDGIVYGLGTVYEEGQYCCFWKDGDATRIMPESAPVSPRGLVVENGDVYYFVTNYALEPDVSILFKNGKEYYRLDGECSGFRLLD
jgi:hypothetical protein